jgi:hypothetical protein
MYSISGFLGDSLRGEAGCGHDSATIENNRGRVKSLSYKGFQWVATMATIFCYFPIYRFCLLTSFVFVERKTYRTNLKIIVVIVAGFSETLVGEGS